MAPAPVVEHLVATRLLARTDPNHPRLAELVGGQAIATVALRPARHGQAELVPAGAVAHVVLALDGGDLVAVDAPPTGVAPDNHASAPIAHRPLDAGQRRVLETGGAALDAYAAALDEWRVLTGASLTGLSRAALDLAVAYVKQRHQFGVPIGSFQAVQHGLADLPGEVVGSHLLVQEAAWALESGRPAPTGASGPELASMAFLFAGELARDATSRCVQYHGGYGVAEEYDAQLLYRRARGWPLLLGDPADELAHLGALLVHAPQER
jgi:alkylation response protein AidB-like acyl-CoA dehydrogenase